MSQNYIANDPRLWKTVSETELLRVGNRLRVVNEQVLLPNGRIVEDFLCFGMAPFVTVVAQTPDGHILCERQYKHGPRRVILTLPAGGVEPGEDLLAAAKRELLEETGYASDAWCFLATRITQANAGGSWTHAFLARACRKVAEPNSGDLEEMTIELLKPQELLRALANGEMPLASDAAALLPGLQALDILKFSTDDAASPPR